MSPLRALWQKQLDGTIIIRVSLWVGKSDEFGDVYTGVLRGRVDEITLCHLRELIPAEWKELVPETKESLCGLHLKEEK